MEGRFEVSVIGAADKPEWMLVRCIHRTSEGVGPKEWVAAFHIATMTPAEVHEATAQRLREVITAAYNDVRDQVVSEAQ